MLPRNVPGSPEPYNKNFIWRFSGAFLVRFATVRGPIKILANVRCDRELKDGGV
jgi:hypothetical protein